MLVALSIRSFLLIDRLDLDAGQGLTVLTGETGTGKSIILDALGLVLGGTASRKMVRSTNTQASVTAEFAVSEEHEVWDVLRRQGVEADRSETVILSRIVQKLGPSRVFINGRPANASLLSKIGDCLVEIHSQHAASNLMRPSNHLAMLDMFAGNQTLRVACKQAWKAYEAAQTKREALDIAATKARERRDWLAFAVEDLTKLNPEQGEAEKLASQRGVLLQSEKLTENTLEADDALSASVVESGIAKAARAVERVLHVQGLDKMQDDIALAAHAAAEAIERTLIELAEARSAMAALVAYTNHDGDILDQIEARLFALRAAGRKYDTDPDNLCADLERYRSALVVCDADTVAGDEARLEAEKAYQNWRSIAENLSLDRQRAAKRLEMAIMTELKPLHLDRVHVRIGFDPITNEDSGVHGLERAEFQVETNAGAGFSSLQAIASGGELARFSLALKCALSATGGAGTLIFDEADQGVGGAVATSIGERLARLAKDRQVFAITHSPQVASCGERQWRVRKALDKVGDVRTHVTQLNEDQRLEEIARMLSGSSTTDEARAAASKLLEAA